MPDIIAELSWRGLINQTTDDANLPRLLMEKPRTLYVGFDPTADSLHVGHLVALMVLRRFQQAGHRPIALVGGATGMIGDPSGKSEERNLLSLDALQANIAGMEPQLRRFLDFDCGPNSAVLVNNYDWMGKFGYLEFLRDVGKHFPVNVMLTKDSVRSRLERTDAGLELHRVQLHAACRPTTSCISTTSTAASCRPAGATSGATSRPASICAGGSAACSSTADLPAVDQQRRHEDGQDRVGRPVALAGEDQPLPVLSVLDQPGRRRRGPLPAVLHRPGPRGDRRAAGRACRRSRPPRRPSGGWPPS